MLLRVVNKHTSCQNESTEEGMNVHLIEVCIICIPSCWSADFLFQQLLKYHVALHVHIDLRSNNKNTPN